jgi:hypothetical protein
VADDDITLASTSDSLEEVQAALGYPPPAVAAAAAAAAPATDVPTTSKTPVAPPPPAPADDAPADEEPAAPAEGDEEAPPDEEAAADDTADEATDDQPATPKPPRRNRLQERLNALSREAYAAKGREAAKEAENVALRARLAELATGRTPAPAAEPGQPAPAAPETVAPEPSPDDYPTYDAYTKAMAQWAAKSVAQQVVEEHAQKTQADEAAARRAEAMQVVNARYNEQLNVVREKYDDFAEVTANDEVRVTQIFADGMKLSPVGAEMLYYLAKNPEYAAQVHKLGNGPHAAREFGKLEARLEMALGLDEKAGDGGDAASGAPTGRPRSEVATPSPAPRRATAPHGGNGNGNGNGTAAPVAARPRVVTKAPDPIRPIDGGNVVSTKPPDQMSFQEFKAYRNRQIREAAGR